jgi:uncharacterized membrane protein
MHTRALARPILLGVQAFVAVTAVAGGLALIIGASIPSLSSILVPPDDYLAGSPFTSYFVPGLLLAGLLGGIHIVAFVAVLTRRRWAMLASAAAAFATLIWIFVQMIYIPFSPLQAVYFAAGIAEAGLVMVLLGVLGRSSANA